MINFLERFDMKPKKNGARKSNDLFKYGLLILLIVYFASAFSCNPPVDTVGDPSHYETGGNQGDSYNPVQINALAYHDKTKRLYVGGRFTSIGNQIAHNIAYLDVESGEWHAVPGLGLTDDEYPQGTSVNALKIFDDKLLIGGTFSRTYFSFGPSTEGLNSVAILNISNANSPTWTALPGGGLNGTVNAVDVRTRDEEDRVAWIGGSFTNSNDGTVTGLSNIARINLSALTPVWQPLSLGGLNGSVNAIQTITDTYAVIGGEFTETVEAPYIPLYRIAVASLVEWRQPDNGGLNGPVYSMDGPYIAGGFTTTEDGSITLNRLAYFDPNDNSFAGINASVGGTAHAIRNLGTSVSQPTIMVGGDFLSVDSPPVPLARIGYVSLGSWIPIPGEGVNNTVRAIECVPLLDQVDMTCFVGGAFTESANGASTGLNGLAKYEVDDGASLLGTSPPTITLDTIGLSNGNALNNAVNGLASDANGNVYAGGLFTGAANTASALNRIAKFDPVTRTWSPLANNGLNGNVEAVWRVGDDLFVGGMFTATADGAVTNLNRMARYNLTAGTWHSVGNNGLNGNVLSFAQKGNYLWVGGGFTRTFDSAVLNLNRLARYDLTLGTWSSVPNNGMNGEVNALAFKGDDLYIGGGFTRTSDNNYFLFYFTKLDTATGTYYELANSGTNFPVERLKLDGNDLYVSGGFTATHDNTIMLDHLGRYDTVLNGWNAVYGYSDELALGRQLRASIDVGPDRYIGGEFHNVGNTVAHYFTRLYGQVWNVPAGSSDWHEGTNWSTGAVPAANTSAVIPSGAGAVNITSNDVVLADLMMNGGTLTVEAGRTLTINGILKLGGGVINGPGTVIITDCRRDRVMGGSATSNVRTTLVRCVNNAGVYNFPVGTANGYSPVFVGEVAGTGNVAVTANQGEYTAPATGLPTNRLQRWWNIENPGGGVTSSQLIFNYNYVDIISNEPTYKAYRISGGDATVASDFANTYTHRATAPNVTAFSDWTIAGDVGGPTPTPTPIPPDPTPTPTPVPSPTPTPTPEPSPTPTPEPTPTPTPEPTPTPPPVPTLGIYSNTSVVLSGNTSVTPNAAPQGALSLSATTSGNFRGTFAADPITGAVRVTNAQPSGVYTVTITAFGSGGSSSTTFDLTVNNGNACNDTSTFTDGTDLFPAYHPTSLAIGDVNNDGYQDLAITSEAFGSVSIMLGAGDGSFTFAGDIGTGLDPRAIALADLNNDGKLDFATANISSGTVSVRLGVGDGTFTNAPNIVGLGLPSAIAAADLNDDGNYDLVVGSYSPGNLRVLIGNGDGTFVVGMPVSVGNGIRDLVIGDVNADGFEDALTANADSNSVSVRLGDGAGGLSGTTEVSVGATPTSLALGKFDGDSNLDLAAAASGTTAISIRNGDGIGGFSGTTELGTFVSPTTVIVADIDNDGNIDIVTADGAAGNDVVNFGDGMGGFSEVLNAPAGSSPYTVRVGDLNNDGRQDLVTGNWLSYQSTIRLGSCYTPTPTPTPTPEPTPTPQTNNISVSDTSFTVNSYNTLKEAIDAINAGSFSGAITVTVNSDTNETAMSDLTYSGNGSANYTSILITPAPGGARVISGPMPDGDALFDFNGADNVTIDGLNSGGTTLTLANTNSTLAGVASTIRFENGATANTIRNTNVLGSNISVIFFYQDVVSGNGNDNNTIEACNIGPWGGGTPARGIYGTGQSSDANIGNSGNIINNNNIYDFHSSVSESNGIFLLGGSQFWQITNNRFYQTAPRVGGSQNVIRLDNPNPPNGVQGMTVTGNVIGGSAADGTGSYSITNTPAFSAIRTRIFFSGAVSNISNNTIANIAVSNPSGPLTFYGIYNEQGPLTTSGNLIGSMTSNRSITIDMDTPADAISAGIINFGTGVNWTANNNQIGGIRAANTNIGAPQLYGIWGFRVTPNTATISGNTVGGSIPNSLEISALGSLQQLVGIGTNFSSNVSGNTIQNLMGSYGTGTGNTASVIGIWTNNAAVNQTVSNNTIRNLTNARTFGTRAVTGIQFTGSTANTVERNHISNLSAQTADSSAEIAGIRASGGATAYRNNMIAMGQDVPNAIGSGSINGGVNGINETGGTNTFYHNSVYIAGSPTAGTGPSYAFASSVTTNTRSYRNNIFYNARSNSGSAGKNYAIRVGGTGTNPAGLTINNNIYRASGSGAVFGFYNSVDRADLGAWQTAVGQDAASYDNDPQFVNPMLPAPDLHLATALVSPAIDTGANLGVAVDFDGQLRPSGGGFDIGADEALAPSAAFVRISGKITTANGNGIRNAVVTLADTNGNVQTGVSGSMGYYNFDEVVVGRTYILTVSSKRYQFLESSRIILIGDDAIEIDFTAMP